MKAALLSFDFGTSPTPPSPVPVVIPGQNTEFAGSLTIENISTGQLNFIKPIDTGYFLSGDFEDTNDLIVGISSQLVSDNFQRANANPIGGNWTPLGSTGGFGTAQIINDIVYPSTVDTADSAYTGIVWPNDQYSQIVIANIVDSFAGVGLRMNPSTTSEYALYVFNQAVPSGTYGWSISVVVNGTENVLRTGTINSPLSPGDAILGQIQGSVLSLYHNGFLLGTAVDSTLSSGSAGFVLAPDSTPTDVGISSWVGGSGSPTPFALNWVAQGLFLKNIDLANPVNVSWIPYGGINTSVLTLQPQGVIGFLGKNSVITQLTLSALAPTHVSYVVIGGGDGASQPPVILSISKTHTGNFSQGQTGATYTIVVSNIGSRPTSGAVVTVTDTVSSGLTFVSMSGSGWSVTGNQAIRSDVLNPGNSYPAITVTVNVASNASSPQVNTACVSGGGLISSVCTTDSTVVTNSCLALSADQAVAAFGGFSGLTFAEYTVAMNPFPSGLPIQVSGTTRAGGAFNISGFSGPRAIGSSATQVIIANANVPITSLGSDSGMICPLQGGDQPFPNYAGAASACGLDPSPGTTSLFCDFAVGTLAPLYIGQLITIAVTLFGSSSFGTLTAISDTSSNTWQPLAPAIEFVTGDGIFVSMQVFWTLNQTFINSGLWHARMSYVAGTGNAGAEFSLNSWNNTGTLLGTPTSSQRNTLGPLSLSLTTSQNAVVLAFPMGGIISAIPTGFNAANSNFGACIFNWYNTSTFSLIAPPGIYSPTFNFSSAHPEGAAGFMAAFTPHI